MRVIFTGDPIELERAEGLSRVSTTLYGVHFPMGAEVDVSHLSPVQQRKLLSNAHFRPAGVDAPAVPLVLPVAVRSAPVAEAADELDAEAAEAAAHAARAKARKKKTVAAE